MTWLTKPPSTPNVPTMAEKKPERGFHPAKLQSMVEPLTVRVEKVVGGQANPVELPPTSGGTTDGTGWTKEDVLKLEHQINQHHGFGVYEGKVADANNVTMQWSFGVRPPNVFQQPAPQQLGFAGGVPPASPIPAFNGGQGNVIWAAPMNPSYQSGWPQAQAQQPAWNGQQWVQPPQVWQPQAPQQQPPWQWQQPATSAVGDSVVQKLQADLEAERRARVESEAKAERERAEARHAGEVAAMREEMAKLREQMTRAPAAPAEDPRLKILEQQAQAAAARAERMEADARMEKMMAGFQQQMQVMQQQTQQQLAALAQNNNQSAMIPLMSLIQTVTQQSTEAAKDMARQVTASQDKTIGFLQSNQQQGSQVLQNVNGAFDTYARVMTGAFEMMQNAQGGPSSVGDKILEGATFLGAQGKSIVDKFLANKEKKVQADLKAKEIDANVEIAKEQMRLQAQALQAGVQQAPQQVAPQGAQVSGGQQGTPVTPAQVAQGQPAQAQQVAQQVAEPKAPPVLRAVPSAADKRDKELFVHDQLIEQLARLRTGVRGVHGKPKLTPEEVAVAVMQAMVKVKQLGLDIPAMKLYEAGEFYELMAACLPSTTSSFHEEAAEAFVALLAHGVQQAQQQAAAAGGEGDGESDDDGDDGGEDGESEEAGDGGEGDQAS